MEDTEDDNKNQLSENDEKDRKNMLVVLKTLRTQAVVNMEYFQNGSDPIRSRFHAIFCLLHEHLELGIEPFVDLLFRIARQYDHGEVRANGYRSIIKIIQRCCITMLQITRHICVNRESMLFRSSHYCKELEAYVTCLGQLRACIFYVEKLPDWSPKGCLFADEDRLRDETADDLMMEVESLNQECFFGRCLGFQYCDSMQKPFRVISIAMASFSDGFSRDTSMAKFASSVVSSGKYFMNPELKGQQIVATTMNADISFCKSFWNLTESDFFQDLPMIVCPPVHLSQPIIIHPDSFELPRRDGQGFTTILPPTAHRGQGPIYCRLISHEFREGQEQLCKKDLFQMKSAPPSPCLIIHCHGGGFVAQSSKSHETYLRHWARDLRVPILSIDYSLAPEDPFPRAVEECFFVYAWALDNCDLLGSTGEHICLCGDSAGGNLVLSICVKAIQVGLRLPDGVMAAYPPVLVRFTPTPSRLLAIMDPLLPVGVLSRCLAAYAGVEEADIPKYYAAAKQNSVKGEVCDQPQNKRHKRSHSLNVIGSNETPGKFVLGENDKTDSFSKVLCMSCKTDNDKLGSPVFDKTLSDLADKLCEEELNDSPGVEVGACAPGAEFDACALGANVGACAHGVEDGACLPGTKVDACALGAKVGACAHGVEVGACLPGTDVGTCVPGTEVGTSTSGHEVGTSSLGSQVECDMLSPGSTPTSPELTWRGTEASVSSISSPGSSEYLDAVEMVEPASSRVGPANLGEEGSSIFCDNGGNKCDMVEGGRISREGGVASGGARPKVPLTDFSAMNVESGNLTKSVPETKPVPQSTDSTGLTFETTPKTLHGESPVALVSHEGGSFECSMGDGSEKRTRGAGNIGATFTDEQGNFKLESGIGSEVNSGNGQANSEKNCRGVKGANESSTEPSKLENVQRTDLDLDASVAEVKKKVSCEVPNPEMDLEGVMIGCEAMKFDNASSSDDGTEDQQDGTDSGFANSEEEWAIYEESDLADIRQEAEKLPDQNSTKVLTVSPRAKPKPDESAWSSLVHSTWALSSKFNQKNFKLNFPNFSHYIGLSKDHRGIRRSPSTPTLPSTSMFCPEKRNISSFKAITSPLHHFRYLPVTKNPLMSPYLASDEVLKQMPPVYLVACHLDPLLDDSVMFSKKLHSVGAEVHLDVFDDIPHGFLNFVLVSKEAKKASDKCVARIREILMRNMKSSTPPVHTGKVTDSK